MDIELSKAGTLGVMRLHSPIAKGAEQDLSAAMKTLLEAQAETVVVSLATVDSLDEDAARLLGQIHATLLRQDRTAYTADIHPEVEAFLKERDQFAALNPVGTMAEILQKHGRRESELETLETGDVNDTAAEPLVPPPPVPSGDTSRQAKRPSVRKRSPRRSWLERIGLFMVQLLIVVMLAGIALLATLFSYMKAENERQQDEIAKNEQIIHNLIANLPSRERDANQVLNDIEARVEELNEAIVEAEARRTVAQRRQQEYDAVAESLKSLRETLEEERSRRDQALGRVEDLQRQQTQLLSAIKILKSLSAGQALPPDALARADAPPAPAPEPIDDEEKNVAEQDDAQEAKQPPVLPKRNREQVRKTKLKDIHFRVKYAGNLIVCYPRNVSSNSVLETLAKVWKHMETVLPKFEERLDEPARAIAFYIVNEPADYGKLATWYRRQLVGTPQYNEITSLIWRVPTFTFTGGTNGMADINCVVNISELPDRREREAFFTHVFADVALLAYAGDVRRDRFVGTRTPLPLWLTAGFGYAVEFELNGFTATRYIDYQEYEGFNPGQAEVFISRTFKRGINWGDAIQRIMKDEKTRGSLEELFSARIASLKPETCGYMYAFARFLTANTKAKKGFARYLEAYRTMTEPQLKPELLRIYGAEDQDELQKEWYRYMMSNSFL